MHILSKDTPLTQDILKNCLSQHLSDTILLNKFKSYYDGKQDILNKYFDDTTKPCNKIITNYCYDIVTNYSGYIIGIPTILKSDADITPITNVLNYNDKEQQDTELTKQLLIYGHAYELHYIDSDGQCRYKIIPPTDMFCIHDDTIDHEILYAIRLYSVDNCANSTITKDYYVQVYDSKNITTYKTNQQYSSFNLISEEQHYYKQVPVIEYNTDDDTSIFSNIMTLQDAYNTLQSAEVDDFEAFCDAYLVITGMDADPDDIKDMKKSRILLLDEGATASYLTKAISDTQIENILKKINDNIHKISKSPDFSDEKLLAQSGIAMRYKLIGFENQSANIVNHLTKGMRKRIELISTILNLTSESDTEIWRDIDIVFTRNLPENLLESAQIVSMLSGTVSNETLLTLLPFVSDPQAEAEKVKQEKDLYPSETLPNLLTGFSTQPTTQQEESKA